MARSGKLIPVRLGNQHPPHRLRSVGLRPKLDDQRRQIRGVIAVSIMALLLMLGTVAPLFADDVFVKGYFRNDGTYVQPHMRSAPDSSYNNNWSTSPNINPYTGQGLGFLIGGFTGAVVGLVVRGIFA